MSDTINGAPPPVLKKWMRVVTVTTAETAEFIAVCKVPYGYWAHWWGGRTHECTQEKGECDKCIKGWPLKWRCIIHVLAAVDGDAKFLEVSPECYLKLTALVPTRTDWRGWRFRVRRTSKGVRGRYICEGLDQRVLPDVLPEPMDPLPLLRFLWNAKKSAGQE